ncbi:hypothetical protein P8A21_39560 (plasmid) [Streptomyces poriferorum]|nr:hypothetical protein [Streptomyces sp. Alt1]WLQ53655.1 hypothetical protein P8A21_39560 [Streptomyces sp. Alt1]
MPMACARVGPATPRATTALPLYQPAKAAELVKESLTAEHSNG